MAESSLSQGFPDFQSAVAFFLGYGVTSTNWTAAQLAEINEIVNAGYRQFLFPPPLDGGTAHDWSFLKPETTLTTTAALAYYTLPDDFGTILGDLTYGPNEYWSVVKVIGEGAIRELMQRGINSGRPMYASITPLAAAGTTGQRFQINFWPVPTGVYHLTYRYIPNVAALASGVPYAWGGMPHSDTILQSCLAIAEQRRDDTLDLHTTKFKERLAASIAFDRRQTQANFGRNLDNSDSRDYPRPVRIDSVTFNGGHY